MAFTETLSDFINTDTPGYATCVIGADTVTCLFDDFYQGVLDIAASGPAALVIADDLASVPAYGSSLTVDGTSYTVAGVEPDGTGMLLIKLQEA